MSDTESSASSVDTQSYEDTPGGWKLRWVMEFDAARKEHKDWQDKGQKIVDRFLDKRTAKSMGTVSTRFNLYTSSIQTKRAMLYGKPPTVDVRPKFSDAPDSAARLAGEIAERLLNSDIERDEDGFKEALDNCLMDRLNPGVGFVRFRYVPKWETVDAKPAQLRPDGSEMAPAVDSYEQKSSEEVETEYVFWKDVLWSPCRTFRDMRWCAFRVQLTKKELIAKFGEEVGKSIALNSKKDGSGRTDAAKADPWQRADLWEIWDKENKCVWFFIESYKEMLKPVDLDDASFNSNGSLKDPLELRNFWPFGKPMLANVTTSAFVPRADFVICQDILDEVDAVSTRITDLERTIAAKGVYNKNATDSLGRILTEGVANQMFPVEGWGAFQEKGGLKGNMELLDLTGLVAALDRLEAYRNSLIQAYYQISGDSDLTRGQQTENGTPGEAGIKAQFASIRMQALQDEFARFASDAQTVRLEIISRHFEPETILERSNIAHSFDADDPALMEAVELLKSDTSCYRVEVKPENVSMQDFSQVRQERSEVIASIASFIQTGAPLAQMMPGSMPFLLEMMQWLVSGLRGASSIQGVMDRAIQAAKNMAQQPQQQGQQQGPDPKVLAQQAKTQGDLQRIQAQAQAEQVGRLQETEQMAIRAKNAAQMDIQKEAVKQRIKAQHQAPVLPAPNGGLP